MRSTAKHGTSLDPIHTKSTSPYLDLVFASDFAGADLRRFDRGLSIDEAEDDEAKFLLDEEPPLDP